MRTKEGDSVLQASYKDRGQVWIASCAPGAVDSPKAASHDYVHCADEKMEAQRSSYQRSHSA